MSFPWIQTAVPHNPAAHRDQIARELRQRAGLLRRLGYGVDAVVARCRQNLAWDFEVNGGVPVTDAELRALVEAVFNR